MNVWSNCPFRKGLNHGWTRMDADKMMGYRSYHEYPSNPRAGGDGNRPRQYPSRPEPDAHGGAIADQDAACGAEGRRGR